MAPQTSKERQTMSKSDHRNDSKASDINIGDNAPDFSLPGDHGQTVSLSAARGQKVVLFFYPKDNTPGCTSEALAFSDNLAAFEAESAKVIGLSPDSPASHDKFIKKHNLAVRLAADEEKTTLEAYGVWIEKSMYGKRYWGVERSTFLIDADGKIAQIWRKVKVPGHVEAVLEAVKAL